MKRIISTILTAVLLFCAVVYGAGCEEISELRYNTIMLADRSTLTEEFLHKEENLIYCLYVNKNYNPDDSSSEKGFWGPLSPTYRIIRVTEQMLSHEVFEEVPVVDLETKMILIILFSAIGSYSYGLKNTIIKDGVLEITISLRQWGMATAPMLVYTIIQLDKLDYTESELIFTKK